MRIDVIFDTICPWCYIGKKRLEASLAAAPMDDLEIHWNAFLLNPEMPPEGMDEREYTRAKFGGEARARERPGEPSLCVRTGYLHFDPIIPSEARGGKVLFCSQ